MWEQFSLNQKQQTTERGNRTYLHLFHAKMLQGAWIVSERTL